MAWLQDLINGESGMAVQLVLITLGLVVLLIVIFWLFRKITGASAPKASRNRVPRLSVTDSTRVDESRYLVLVRRDNVEHLVMIGGPSDIVVETNILRIPANAQPVSQRQSAPAKPEPEAEAEITEDAAPPKPFTMEPLPAAKLVSNVGVTASAAVAGAATIATISAKMDEPEPPKEVVMETPPAPFESPVDTYTPPINAAIIETQAAPEVIKEPKIIAPNEPVSTEIPDTSAIAAEIEPETIVEPTLEAEHEIAQIDEIPEIEISDLEASISEQLGDVLAGEDIDLGEIEPEIIIEADASSLAEAEVTPVTSVEKDEITIDTTETVSVDDTRDDMQRLLDELAGIKEPAQ